MGNTGACIAEFKPTLPFWFRAHVCFLVSFWTGRRTKLYMYKVRGIYSLVMDITLEHAIRETG